MNNCDLLIICGPICSRDQARSIKDLLHLKHGQPVKIGGLIVTVQHPPTANGYGFLAVEDPDGMVNVIVSPDVYAQCRAPSIRRLC